MTFLWAIKNPPFGGSRFSFWPKLGVSPPLSLELFSHLFACIGMETQHVWRVLPICVHFLVSLVAEFNGGRSPVPLGVCNRVSAPPGTVYEVRKCTTANKQHPNNHERSCG